MVRHIEAIFSQGTFKPLEPLALPEGARVHLRIEQDEITDSTRASKMHTPKLAHPEDMADFVMQVRETGNAGV
jgi:predicted DNA-binding antitoxin AbrB/MazE fold protein